MPFPLGVLDVNKMLQMLFGSENDFTPVLPRTFLLLHARLLTGLMAQIKPFLVVSSLIFRVFPVHRYILSLLEWHKLNLKLVSFFPINFV